MPRRTIAWVLIGAFVLPGAIAVGLRAGPAVQWLLALGSVGALSLWIWRRPRSQSTREATDLRFTPLSEATRQHIDSMFRRPENELAALLLRNHCGHDLPFRNSDSPDALERIRFAALKQSGGDIEKLKRAILLAQTDWRDLLVAADFAHDSEAHKHWTPGEGASPH